MKNATVLTPLQTRPFPNSTLEPHSTMQHLTRLLGFAAFCGAMLLLPATDVSAAVSVNPDIAYYFGAGPGEGVSVSSDGKFIMVSSPVNVSGETNYSSSVPHLVHTPLAPEPFNLTQEVPLTGFGEVTDVGVLPGGPFGLAVVRRD